MRHFFSVLPASDAFNHNTGEAYLYEGVAATSFTELSVFD